LVGSIFVVPDDDRDTTTFLCAGRLYDAGEWRRHRYYAGNEFMKLNIHFWIFTSDSWLARRASEWHV